MNPLPALLLLLVLAWGTPLRAEEPGGERGATEPGPAPLALPFAHRVGDRFRLRLERERRGEGRGREVRVELADVTVLSPYGRDQLVEVTWRSVQADGQGVELWPRRVATEAGLDRLGGGRWLLRVDVTGSARALLNAEEAEAAWARARGRALSPDERAAAEEGTLESWNLVYAACGVPLVPSAEHVTWVGEDGVASSDAPGEPALLRGRLHDVRVLRLERDAQRVTAWAVHARTHFHAGAEAVPTERTAGTRFDLATRRLSGWQQDVRRGPHGAEVERVAFEELAPAAPPVVPDDVDPALAAR